MSNLVRFAAAGVVVLGGVVGAVNVVACSSSTTTQEVGDDDDGGEKNTSSSSSSGASSSSTSSGGSPVDAGPPCDPSGTYAFGTPALGADGGKVCSDYAANSGGGGPTVTFTKNTADAGLAGITYVATEQGNNSKVLLLLANNECQLAGAEQPFGQSTRDGNGVQINVELSPNDIYTFTPDLKSVTFQDFVQVASDPAGAPGTPCEFYATSTGTKQ